MVSWPKKSVWENWLALRLSSLRCEDVGSQQLPQERDHEDPNGKIQNWWTAAATKTRNSESLILTCQSCWRASTKLSWKHKVAPELIPSWFHRNPWFPDVLSFSCEYEEVELVRICSRNQHGTQQIQKEMSNEKLSSYTLFCKVLFSSFLACHVHPFPVQQSSFLCFQPFPSIKIHHTIPHGGPWPSVPNLYTFTLSVVAFCQSQPTNFC